MTTLQFRAPVLRPVHPFEWTRPAGNLDFKVTQRYGARDAYFNDGRIHGAVDLGNRTCGQAVVSMAPGRVGWRQDGAGALGVVIDHGHGVTTEYWHLASRVADLRGRTISAGVLIGTHGATGLDIGGCHLHVEAKVDGRRIDPEPLIFGGTLEVGDDMKLPGTLQALIRGTVPRGTRLRTNPYTADGAVVTPADVVVQVLGSGVKGAPYDLGGGVAGNEYVWIGYEGAAYFVARPLVHSLDLSGMGRTVNAPPETILESIRTAAEGARQAIEAIEGLAK